MFYTTHKHSRGLRLCIYLLPTVSLVVAAPMGLQSSAQIWNPRYNNIQRAEGARFFQLHPHYDSTKCLDVRGSVFENGTPVDIYDCNGSPAQRWSIAPGTTKLKVAGQNFCLDSGSIPVNGTRMKIWTCCDDLVPAQTWYYTNDKRIALKDQGKCLDLTDGESENYNAVQLWQCTDQNTNQIWTVY